MRANGLQLCCGSQLERSAQATRIATQSRLQTNASTHSSRVLRPAFTHVSTAPARNASEVRAQGNGTGVEEETEEDVARREELERGRRRKKPGSKTRNRPAAGAGAPSPSGMAEWREGELLPQGWENMSAFQKGSELWMGKRGALFWANKLAWVSVFVIGGGWFFFRVIGPALGLYTLKNDLLSPPNL